MLLILLYVTVLFKENAVFYDWQVQPKSIFTAFTASASRYLTEAIIHTGAVIWIPVLPFFPFRGGLSFVLAQPGSCIPRALVDSRSPNLVLTVEKKWLQIPGLSANDNTVTGPQQRFNAYQRVRLAVYKTRIPAQSLKQEFSPFFPLSFCSRCSLIFSRFLPLSCFFVAQTWVDRESGSQHLERAKYMVAQ